VNRHGAEELFGREQVERGRRYHRPLYVVLAANTAAGIGVLAALTFAGPGLGGWPWWAAALTIGTLAVVAPSLAHTPLAFWFGHVPERRWGFSTQSSRGWAADRAKALVVGVVLTVPLLVGLVGLARALPQPWPVAAAAGAAVVVLFVGLVAPVVIEPIFNRFAPLSDDALAADLRDLALRAGTPVRDILVADASRRTRKVNAYVSGLGPTRRVVLFDTLLEQTDPRETSLVVAHELGHRKAGHLLKGTLLGMVGAAAAVVCLWALLRWPGLLEAMGAEGPGDPRVIPFVLLLFSALEVAALPAGAAIARRWERQADAVSLDLTHDVEAFEQAHRRLAVANVADLDPPLLVYLLLFTHPTQPERIAYGRRGALERADQPPSTGLTRVRRRRGRGRAC
jgi:Zn-dependent protease with chaperone function